MEAGALRLSPASLPRGDRAGAALSSESVGLRSGAPASVRGAQARCAVDEARPLQPCRRRLPATGSRSTGQVGAVRITGAEPAGRRSSGWCISAPSGAASCPLTRVVGENLPPARCQYLAPRAREQPSRPFLGTPRQTSPRADPSSAPPTCADHTSQRSGRRPTAGGR